jgi:hypothetical protein
MIVNLPPKHTAFDDPGLFPVAVTFLVPRRVARLERMSIAASRKSSNIWLIVSHPAAILPA